MANTLNFFRNGAVGFIDWLDVERGIITGCIVAALALEGASNQPILCS